MEYIHIICVFLEASRHECECISYNPWLVIVLAVGSSSQTCLQDYEPLSTQMELPMKEIYYNNYNISKKDLVLKICVHCIIIEIINVLR